MTVFVGESKTLEKTNVLLGNKLILSNIALHK